MSIMIKLPGEKWWVEFDDVNNEIVASYYKPSITADINAMNATLATLPSPSQDATDVESVLGRITASTWTEVRKARCTALVNAMYQAYQGNPQQLEIAQLIARRDALVELRNRLVV